MGRTTKLLFGLIAVVGVAPVGFLILDSAGRPEHQDSCEVVSTLFSQGTTTTDYIDAGNHVSVPIRREIPEQASRRALRPILPVISPDVKFVVQCDAAFRSRREEAFGAGAPTYIHAGELP